MSIDGTKRSFHGAANAIIGRSVSEVVTFPYSFMVLRLARK